MADTLPGSIGRYALFDEIASGGMATVYFGRQMGLAGFARTVAIKRLHRHLASDPEFVAMFLDEARLASRIRHPNVVATLDVAADQGELIVVMDYVHGDALSGLLRKVGLSDGRAPLDVVSAVISQALYGLHAAHEAKSEGGAPLDLVHRDVSPHNILVGIDGLARVVDFGVAKAAGRSRSTGDGAIKGKLAYMSPEQLRGEKLDRRTDVYAMGIVLWETLAARRMIEASNHGEAIMRVLLEPLPSLREAVAGLPEALYALVERALEKDREGRFATAKEMALALEDAVPPARASVVGAWVEGLARDTITKRADVLSKVERESSSDVHRQAQLGDSGERPSLAEPDAPRSTKRAVPSDRPTESYPKHPPVSAGALASPPANPGSIHDISSASHARDIVRPGEFGLPKPKRAQYTIVVLGGLLAVAVALLLLRERSDPPKVAASSPTSPASGIGAALVATTETVKTPNTAAPSAPPAPSSADSVPSSIATLGKPTTSTSPADAGRNAAARPPPNVPTTTGEKPPPKPTTGGTGCFVVDDKGFETYKPNCRN